MAALLLFDGDCGFCSTAARTLQRLVRPDCIVMPYQHVDLARWQVAVEQAAAEIVFVRREGDTAVVSGGSQALADVLQIGQQPWPVAAAVLRAPGVRSVAGLVYRAVAANRHRLPGGTPACRLDGATAVVGAD